MDKSLHILFILFLTSIFFIQLNGQELMIESASNAGAAILLGTSNSNTKLKLSSAPATARIGTNNGASFNITHGSDSRLFIGANGKIGIGTKNPLEDLYIQDGGLAAESMVLGLSTISRVNSNSMLFNNPKGFNFLINGVNGLNVNSFGRIRIGDMSPFGRPADTYVSDSGVSGEQHVVAILESKISNRPFMLFRENYSSSSPRKGMAMGYRRTGSQIPAQIQIITNQNQVAMTFHGKGNVGFATASPNYKADVNGSVRIRRDIRLGTKSNAPSACKSDMEGAIYFDKSLSKLRLCTIENGNFAWVNLN